MKIVWVRRAISGADAGDSVFDAKLIAELRRAHEIEEIAAPRASGLMRLAAAAAHLSTPDTFGYNAPATLASLRRAIALRPDWIVFSHEHLDRLAAAMAPVARKAGVRLAALRHNVTSDAMGEILSTRPLIAKLYRARAAAQERRALSGPLYDLVTAISHRDRALLIGRGRADAALILPGAPPQTPLPEAAAAKREALLIGTFDWFAKAQDLRRFAAEYAKLSPAPAVIRAEQSVPEDARRILGAQAAAENDQCALRFGIITDRFAAGHKLKTAAYIARNCIVLTYAPVVEDFAFSPHAATFIRQISHAREIGPIVDEICAMPPELLRRNFAAFKASVAQELSWPRQAEALAALLRSRAGAASAPISACTAAPVPPVLAEH